jgi:hypothetical protein
MRDKKSDPIPTRFDGPEDEMIREMHSATGLSMAEIIRRSVRFAGPKFRSGEINILDIVPEKIAANGEAVPA